MTSLQIAKVRGIPIRVHISFLLILPILALLFGRVFGQAAQAANVPPERITGAPWLWGLGLAIALFASVVLHELAHAFYAVKSGGQVRDITLLMIGGVSRIEEPPSRARDEAWMSLVGPIVSLLIGGLSIGVYRLLGGANSFNLRFAFFYLGQLNIFLGIFNLLPAFPMDGGRIVRALLVKRFGRVRATRIAGNVGKGFALLFAIIGAISFNLILLFIAFFVYMGAASETQQVMLESALEGLKVRDVMTRSTDRVNASASVAEVLQDMKKHRILALPVVEESGEVLGVATLDSVRRIPARSRGQKQAREATSRVEPLDADADAKDALKILVTQRVPSLPVVEDHQLVGRVGQADIVRTIELRRAEGRKRGRRGFRREVPAET
jgi:Zn-dependent protease/CBS domain-containing protein